MKTILVTGGAGFIGSNLCERLLAQGDEVICVDNCFSGSRSNIYHLLNRPEFEFIRHDINIPLYVEVDEVYNLACPASPTHYQSSPLQTIKTSVNGVVNMLGLAKRVGAKILQASTSEVYGDPMEHPQKEDYWGNVNPIGPRSCYDEGKRCAETLFFNYSQQYDVDTKVARIFNTYGPRMQSDDGRVVSNFIVQALRGEDVTVYGDGSQTRSFCYVDDMVDGLIRIMASETVLVNLGNSEEISIRKLAQLIVQMTDSESRIVFKYLPKDDPKRRCPDISLARQQLGWQPEVSLEVGLRRTINYFKHILSCSERVGKTDNNLGSSTCETDVSKAEPVESNVSL